MSKILDYDDALTHPLDYEVSYSALGWMISEIESNVAVLLTEKDAIAFIEKMRHALAEEMS